MADASFPTVVQLAHFNGSDGSTQFDNSCPRGTTITAGTGISTIATAQSVFGGASLRHTTGKSPGCTASTDYQFGTNDFTIEFRYRPDSVAAATVLDMRDTGLETSAQPTIYSQANGTLAYYHTGADRIVSAAGVIVAGTWKAIAVSRVSGVTRMFVDGTQVGASYTDSTNYNVVNTRVWCGSNNTGATNVYYDELRISNGAFGSGAGRYAANYTVATQPFSDGVADAEGVTLTSNVTLVEGIGYGIAGEGATLTVDVSLLFSNTATGVTLTNDVTLVAGVAGRVVLLFGDGYVAPSGGDADLLFGGEAAVGGSGVTLDVAVSFSEGAAIAAIEATVDGVTLDVAVSFSEGAASAATVVDGVVLDQTVTLIPGVVSGSVVGAGATFEVTVSLLAGAGSAVITKPGVLFAQTVRIIPGTATGNIAPKDATKAGVLFAQTVKLAVVGKASVTPSIDATATGALLPVTVSLIAGTTTIGASPDGTLFTQTVSLIAGTVFVDDEAGAEVLPLTVTLIDGTAIAGTDAQVAGVVLPITVSFIPADASAGINATVEGELLVVMIFTEFGEATTPIPGIAIGVVLEVTVQFFPGEAGTYIPPITSGGGAGGGAGGGPRRLGDVVLLPGGKILEREPEPVLAVVVVPEPLPSRGLPPPTWVRPDLSPELAALTNSAQVMGNQLGSGVADVVAAQRAQHQRARERRRREEEALLNFLVEQD